MQIRNWFDYRNHICIVSIPIKLLSSNSILFVILSLRLCSEITKFLVVLLNFILLCGGMLLDTWLISIEHVYNVITFVVVLLLKFVAIEFLYENGN